VNERPRYDRSEELLQQALEVIPLGAQTFSKSVTQYPRGAAPLFIDRADGSRAWDVDGNSYLPDDILCKVDRASMAVSLETRVPFLDYRVAEVAARIPLPMKIRGGRGKVILRKLLDRYVPSHLVDRPKAGFAVPVGEWIKGPLRGWAEELLDVRGMHAEGWFDAEAVAARWRDHLSGRQNATAALWAVLMFQAWLREQKVANAAAA
jgi:asparagine synthase (glutamine-hydrolysing)